MGRIKQQPRYNVISMRISEEELKHLEYLMEKTHKSVSHIMRDAMELYAANYDEQAKPNRKAA